MHTFEKPVIRKRDRSIAFANEKELQNYMATVLSKFCKEVETEARTKTGGRADIVTDEYLIECKPVLHATDIKTAAGQLLGFYQNSFPGRELIIAGLSPRGDAAKRSAKATAERLYKESMVQVWFIDEMEAFLPKRSRASGKAFSTAQKTSGQDPKKSTKLWRLCVMASIALVIAVVAATGAHGLVVSIPFFYLAGREFFTS